MEGRTVAYSKTIMSRVMLPSEANSEGNVHGGEIIKFMDTAAYVAARKHCRTNVVTARIDELEFHSPILVGQLVTCEAKLVFVGRTSMEVAVKVEVEDLRYDEPPKIALTAFFTMVSLDENCKPKPVPPLILETPEEEELFKEGQRRYRAYKARRNKNK